MKFGLMIDIRNVTHLMLYLNRMVDFDQISSPLSEFSGVHVLREPAEFVVGVLVRVHLSPSDSGSILIHIFFKPRF